MSSTPLTAQVAGEPLRMLAIHAHPDDETLYTGGTLAAYQAAGAHTAVLTCTLGEEGEVIGDTYAQLVAADGGADQLGGYRIHELTGALRALGAGSPHFLGGAGHFRDSGMLGSPANDHPRAFLRASADHVAELMACWIRWLKPHVVLVYDSGGTYGHPDHIRAHQCGTRAVEKAAAAGDTSVAVLREAGLLADPVWRAAYARTHGANTVEGARGSEGAAYPPEHVQAAAADTVGEDALAPAWDVPLLYWIMQSASLVEKGLADSARDIPAQWRIPAVRDIFATADGAATHTITLDEASYAAKIAALKAHATQVSVSQPEVGAVSFAMSNKLAQPLLHTEEFRLVRRSSQGTQTASQLAPQLGTAAPQPADIAAELAATTLNG